VAEVGDRLPAEAVTSLTEGLTALPGLDATDSVIVAFVIELTLQPGRVKQAGLIPLRAAGLDDRAIHDLVQVACCFAYMNRLADGTGVLLLEHQYELARELFGEAALATHLRWGEKEA